LEKARSAAEWARQNNQIAKKGAEDRRRAFEQALEMARKDMVADNLVGARGALERATLLDPDNPDLKKDYDDLLKRERAGTSRESAMVRLRTGQTHLTADRWGEALRDFETVLAIIPDNAEARAGQQKAIAGLKSLEELEEKRLQYLVQLDDGRKALRDRRFDDAEASFQRAAKIMRDEKEPQRLLDQVRTDRRELDNTVSMIIRSAQAFLAQNKPSEAFYRLLDADFLSPRNPQVRRLMADAQQRMALTKNMNNPFISDPKYQNWMAQGRMALTQGNPFMAMEAFQNALAQSNNSDPFARQAFFEARRQSDSLGQKAQEFQKVFSDAKILYTAKRYSQALPLLENAMTMFPGEVRVAEMLEECRYQDLIEKARSALSRDPAETERLADLALRMRPAEVTPRNLIKQARAIRFAKVPEPRFPVQ
jgi:tetratricopeptide (TPR) repeat protein